MLASMLLIIALAFAFIILTVMNVTATFLMDQRNRENLGLVDEFALEVALSLKNADAENLYELSTKRATQYGARFLVLNEEGTVLIDSLSSLSGVNLAHGEVLDILGGKSNLSYGLHKAELNDASASGDQWLGYYTAAIFYDAKQIGIAMVSVSVQDVIDQLNQIQQTLLLYFALAIVAVAGITLWLSGLITKPINALNAVMQQAVRQGFSVRAQVKGHDEVAQLSETFNAMSEKLQNTDKMRNDFISNASHELKTPLSSMKIMAETLLSMEQMDESLAREFLSDINQEIDRLNMIVQDLLTLVRFDGKSMPLKKETISFDELTYDTVSRLGPIAEKAEVQVELQADETLYVHGDALRLSQVIYNLVDNAIKYTPQGGHVRVTLGHEGDRVVLRVSDTGIGIPKASLSHVFDRFYRVDKARSRATGGTGLGLSIVQNIVRVHDGDISVESQEDVGTTFTVWLPAAEDPYLDFIDDIDDDEEILPEDPHAKDDDQ